MFSRKKISRIRQIKDVGDLLKLRDRYKKYATILKTVIQK